MCCCMDFSLSLSLFHCSLCISGQLTSADLMRQGVLVCVALRFLGEAAAQVLFLCVAAACARLCHRGALQRSLRVSLPLTGHRFVMSCLSEAALAQVSGRNNALSHCCCPVRLLAQIQRDAASRSSGKVKREAAPDTAQDLCFIRHRVFKKNKQIK